MSGKNNPQIDVLTHMIFERLISKDRLLVLMNSIIDISFIYDIFDKKDCCNCPLSDQCLYKDKNGKLQSCNRVVDVLLSYDAVLNDMKRNETQEFEEANNKRFKIERRFATMVRNHGLR